MVIPFRYHHFYYVFLTIQYVSDGVLLYLKKDDSYRLMITDSALDKEKIKTIQTRRRLHEVVIADPTDEDYFKREDTYISMSDIDSFRRIQQIILRGMIYSDKARDICPFCGCKLSKHKRFDYDQCEDCLTQVKSAICPETNQPYVYTDTPHHRKYVSTKLNTDPDNWYIERQIESSMYFRNITKIDQDGKIICPHCHKAHATKV